MIIVSNRAQRTIFAELTARVEDGSLHRCCLDIHGYALELNGAKDLISVLCDKFYSLHSESDEPPRLRLFLLADGSIEAEIVARTGMVDRQNVTELLGDDDLIAYVVPDTGYLPSFFSSIVGSALFKRCATAGLLPLHAAAVARGTEALLFPGNRRSGKTTIAFTLLREGFSYFADDAALVDCQKRIVVHLSTAIKPRAGTMEMFSELLSGAKQYVEIDGEPRWCSNVTDIYPGSVAQAGEVKWIVFPRFEPGSVPELTALTTAQAAVKLLGCLKTGQALSERWHHLDDLTGLCSGAECYSFRYRGSDELVTMVNRLLRGRR